MFKVSYDETFNVKVVFSYNDNTNKDDLFKGDLAEVYNDLSLENKGLIYVGLGSIKDSLNVNDTILAGFNVGKLLNNRRVDKVSIDFENVKNNLDDVLRLFYEGLIHSQYKFEVYKVKKTNLSLKDISLVNTGNKDEIINEVTGIMEGVKVARDFVNLAPIDLYPESYANEVVKLFKNSKVEIEVLNKKQIEQLKMDSLLSVSLGSDREPRVIVYKYFNNPETEEHLTVVGKGVTYDSGGYALKPAGSMATMKSDMAGSAAVAGLFKSLDLNQPKVNVVGITALTENLINGNAFKNGDIINSMKGTTIEVLNTDAEGRLTLADAIYYAATHFKTTKIIELSTLTGAAIVALSGGIVAMLSNNDEFANQVHQIGIDVNEFNWRMPITKDLEKAVKSDIAELKNSVAGGGGMMTAGIFLEHFAEGLPFVHLDIAGPSFGKPKSYLPNGASGVGVKTLYELLKQQQNS